MLQSAESCVNGPVDDIGVHDCAAFGPQRACVRVHADVFGSVADHESAKAPVADDDVRAHAKEEKADVVAAGDPNGRGELFVSAGFDEYVSCPAELKCGVRGERNVTSHPLGAEYVMQVVDGALKGWGSRLGRARGHRGACVGWVEKASRVFRSFAGDAGYSHGACSQGGIGPAKTRPAPQHCETGTVAL